MQTNATYRTYGLPTAPDAIGDWEGREQDAAAAFDALATALIDAATAAGMDEQGIRELLNNAWDVWGSEAGLPDLTSADVDRYVAAHVPASR